MSPALCLLSLIAAAGQPPTNIYPDPGFEKTGVVGVAHSGERAGTLEIGDRQHWVMLDGSLSVEPFATYRATAWVRGGAAEGSALALYVYQWDSYVWAFGTQASVTAGDAWQQVSVDFCVPTDTVPFHPLAFMDAAHGKTWIDDVSVVRVRPAEETMDAIAAKKALGDDEARLLVRWWAKQGKLAEAEKLLARDLPRGVKADIACVLAKATPAGGKRASLLAAMVANGATSLNDGRKRIAEVSEGLPPDAVWGAVLSAIQSPSADAQSIDSLAAHAGDLTLAISSTQTLADRRQSADSLRKLVDGAMAKAAAGSPARAALDKLTAALAAVRAELDAAQAQLGKCTVTIGGRVVRPESHSIVIPAKPTPQESLAARDLQAHLEKITGSAPPVVAEGKVKTPFRIVVGKCQAVKGLGVAVDYAGLGADGIRIRTNGPNLVLTGNKRGVLYAVYSFLEDQLGCRWFTPDCSTWPREGRLNVGRLDIAYVPPLEYRATDYPGSRPPEFAVRNKYNGTQIDASEEWGGKISYRGFVHTFNYLVPPEAYFDAHPEYFSEINGKRVRDYTQLCLTNPDVLRIAIETVRQWIKESPEATIISVSQNDWHNYCTCPKCTALAEEEGSQSGPLLHFVNAIADDIAKDYPHIIIDTLAYQYTRKPPKLVKPRPNVAIRLCSIECEFNRPLETSPFNKTFVDDIRGWNQICDRLHIWDYVINYAHCVQPFPNLRVLQPNIRFFIENGVTGIYEEANYFSRGGEMAELRTYLMAKALWEPGYDTEKGIDEFVAAYYGPAAPVIRRYIDDTHDLAVSDDDFHMPIYVGPKSPFQTDEALARYEGWFDEAEALVRDDPIRLHRVEVARLPIIYTRIAQGADRAYKLGPDALEADASDRITTLIDRFERIARAEGLTAVSEGGVGNNLDRWLAHVRSRPQREPVARLQGGGLEAVVIPGMGGRILSLKRLADGREFMDVSSSAAGIDPTVGGYEEFSESNYRSPGWNERYEVTDRSAGAITLRAGLANGLAIERQYALDATRPLLRVSTKLTNASQEARTACLRVHPCFRMDDATRAAVRLGPPGAKEVSLASGQSRETELWLRGNDRPAGEWALLDQAAGVALVSRFDPAQVEICYLNWNGPDRRANLELWLPSTNLQPGESISFAHSYEIV